MPTPSQQEEIVQDVRHYLEVSYLLAEPLRLRTFRLITVEMPPPSHSVLYPLSSPNSDKTGRFPVGSHSDPTGALAARLIDPVPVQIPEVLLIPSQTVAVAVASLPAHLHTILHLCVIGPERLSTRDAGARFRTSKTQISRFISEALVLTARTLYGAHRWDSPISH